MIADADVPVMQNVQFHTSGLFLSSNDQKEGSAGPTVQICRLLDGWPCCITKHRSELQPELMKQCHGGDISSEGTEVRHRGKCLQHPCWFKRCSLSQAGFGWFVISQLVLIPAETFPGNRIHQECSKNVKKKILLHSKSVTVASTWKYLGLHITTSSEGPLPQPVWWRTPTKASTSWGKSKLLNSAFQPSSLSTDVGFWPSASWCGKALDTLCTRQQVTAAAHQNSWQDR